MAASFLFCVGPAICYCLYWLSAIAPPGRAREDSAHPFDDPTNSLRFGCGFPGLLCSTTVQFARSLRGFFAVIRLLSPQELDCYPLSTIHYPLRLRLCRAGLFASLRFNWPSENPTRL